ncbi:hypothetical protein B0T21DRAFT_333295 [Apiosordaria backusii]|uniref:2EXR domain-containing protein n=1 Tax=Apiosordaria backusii TaxID=314023 RepID=A0AA40BM71_9PEZI|nr:hypothetical protein B0T21DRAFT_333295 [Apiosordaria backusii]
MMASSAANTANQQLPGAQNGPYKYLRLHMDRTVPSIPAWRFTRFPELPDELQVIIWEMALESELKKVPRIIPVHSFLPPVGEIHGMARVLAQTCIKSREVALKCLDECTLHEKKHQFYSETPEDLHSSESSLRATAQLPHRRLPPIALETPSTTCRAICTDRLKNPLHNHVHIDRDYLLFTGNASKLLRLDRLDAQSYVYGVQKIMVPSTVLWSLFSHSMFGDLDLRQNLVKNVTEVVILLPIDMTVLCHPSLSDPGRCPSLSTSGFLARVLKDGILKENQRWAQASEVPYKLIRFWTDEEMDAFAASCLEREKYQPWNHDLSSSNNQNPPANNNQHPLLTTIQNQGSNVNQNLTNLMNILQQNGFLSSSGPLHHSTATPSNPASSPNMPSPFVSGTTTPTNSEPSVGLANVFRDMQETNTFLYGLFQCWKELFTGRDEEKVPVVRFAHVKGSETDQNLRPFLTRFNGMPEKEYGLDWKDYIPVQAAEEIRSQVLGRALPLTNVKMGERYSSSGEFEVETVNPRPRGMMMN